MKDWVELDEFTVQCMVGILAEEQVKVQPVQVSLRLALDLEPVAGGDLSKGVNYAAVGRQVAFLLQFGQWRLIESAAFGIARLLLAPPSPAEHRGQVDEVQVRLRKPEILSDAVPGIGVTRDALWCDLETRMVPPKLWVDVLVETNRTGAYRVHLEGGTSWNPPGGAAMMTLGGVVQLDGVPTGPDRVVARGAVREVHNPGADPVTLLVVSSDTLGA